MRNLRLAIVLVVLCWFVSDLPAKEIPDFTNAKPLGQAQVCRLGVYQGICFRLEMYSTEFIVIMDDPTTQEGIMVIYSVKPSSLEKPVYRIEDLTVVYERDEKNSTQSCTPLAYRVEQCLCVNIGCAFSVSKCSVEMMKKLYGSLKTICTTSLMPSVLKTKPTRKGSYSHECTTLLLSILCETIARNCVYLPRQTHAPAVFRRQFTWGARVQTPTCVRIQPGANASTSV